MVALNVAVLRLNVRLEELGQERAQIRADNAQLSSEIAAAAASGRIAAVADQLGSAREPDELRPTSTSANEAREQADPAGPRRLRVRFRGHVPARRLAPGSAGRQLRTPRSGPAPRDDRRSRLGGARSSTARASSLRSDARRRRSTRTRARFATRRRPRRSSLTPSKLDPQEVELQLSDRSRGFVYIARKAEPERVKILKERRHRRPRLRHRGATVLSAESRRGPGRRLRGHGQPRARRARARARRHALRQAGKRDGRSATRSGHAINVLNSTAAQEGQNVTLTIDHTIQAQAESGAPQDDRPVARDSRPRRSCSTRAPARVLAMAVERGYDANRFPIVPEDRQRNRTVTDTYEPGSTFKIVTVSAVLAEGLATPQTAFTLPYEIHVADRVIKDAHPRGTERMTVDQILSYSSNVGTITLAEKLGSERLSEWISRFGFGHKTGIDFPGETRGIVPPLERWSGSTIGTLPIGHGIAITPVQMAAAYGTVANDGVWLQPHLVDRIGSKGKPAGRLPPDPHTPRRAPGAADDGGRRHRGNRPGGAAPGLHGRGQDRDRRQARPGAAATRPPSTSPRSSASCRRRIRASSSSSRSTSPARRSGAASSRLRPSSRSPALTCNTWKFRRTPRRRSTDR